MELQNQPLKGTNTGWYYAKKSKELLYESLIPYLLAESKKPIFVQLQEMWLLYKAYGFVPTQYLRNQIFLKERREEAVAFLPPRLASAVQWRVNDQIYHKLVDDKFRFYLKLKAHNIPTAEILLHTDREGNIFRSDGKSICSDAARSLLREWDDDIFTKPKSGINGRNCYSLRKGENKLDELKFPPKTLYQQQLKQHPIIDQLNSNSVNCVRIDTTVLDGAIQNSAAIIKIGSKSSVVDNLKASRGLCVKVDLESGRLASRGFRSLSHGGGSVTEIPGTQVPLGSVSIPFWSEVLELVQRAAAVCEPLVTLGWDVAITRTGPVIIEANHNWDVWLTQLAAGGLRDTPFGELVRRHR